MTSSQTIWCWGLQTIFFASKENEVKSLTSRQQQLVGMAMGRGGFALNMCRCGEGQVIYLLVFLKKHLDCKAGVDYFFKSYLITLRSQFEFKNYPN